MCGVRYLHSAAQIAFKTASDADSLQTIQEGENCLVYCNLQIWLKKKRHKFCRQSSDIEKSYLKAEMRFRTLYVSFIWASSVVLVSKERGFLHFSFYPSVYFYDPGWTTGESTSVIETPSGGYSRTTHPGGIRMPDGGTKTAHPCTKSDIFDRSLLSAWIHLIPTLGVC